ncbi:IclR family transcriptional regulator [Enhydrobacter sp.]|jgi:DNA-binding IclR family transcriptional regulator|uniref:IclR family transcriptional regulator n=1 Tax=Enhydrobacter sp. TaxID=1894999 RepID=UPI00262285BF|nr:IclR family transcriptional regulator [Enhydrobacter sp.]WIM10335.1 MAG: Transcriptional regulator, IclR family [Enhydrobacter sp.]
MSAPRIAGRRVIVAPRPQPARAEPRPSARSQSLERGLDVLETIAAEGGELGVRELARRLGLSPTVVQRLVSSLATRGYIEKNDDTSRYRLGHRTLALGVTGEGAFDYVVAARRELERLAHDHHLNGFLSVLRGGRAIYLLAVQADGPVAIRVSPGSEMPLHSTGAGKVLLASLSDNEARKVVGTRRLAAITPHTITDPAALVALLPKVRRQGFALVNEENIPGVLSVGAPIRDRTGAVVAALSVAFPKYLDSGLTLASVEPLVTAAALRISRLLGMPASMPTNGTTGSV